MPSDRNRRPTEARTFGSSSMTKTVEFAADIAATQIKGSWKMNLCLGSQVWPRRAVVVPISGPEQPPFLSRGHAASIKVYTNRWWFDGIFGAQLRHFAPEISQSLRGTGIASGAFFAHIRCGADDIVRGARMAGASELPGAARRKCHWFRSLKMIGSVANPWEG